MKMMIYLLFLWCVAWLKFAYVLWLELRVAKLAVQQTWYYNYTSRWTYFWLRAEWCWATSKTLKGATKHLRQIGSIKSKGILINHCVISFKHFIETPADGCSRGSEIKRLGKVKKWFNNPEFLWKPTTICNMAQ